MPEEKVAAATKNPYFAAFDVDFHEIYRTVENVIVEASDRNGNYFCTGPILIAEGALRKPRLTGCAHIDNELLAARVIGKRHSTIVRLRRSPYRRRRIETISGFGSKT